ncbi:hypothetical protein AWC38_SpisGene20568 [Stylophora pistillata]|uniref:Uncharacterized protein n=1 Tax=Stylophora pistillata TaxID=50429 RepID=A0A2B4RFU0_STYPI|nr:hypothetical protein AWC38_SpisGene20568 [Stylophora pistillata]
MARDEVTKIHPGGVSDVQNNEKLARMYESSNGNDGYKAMELYISMLNPKSDASFQYPKKQWNYDDDVSYDARPIGVNKLNNMMKSISEAANCRKCTPTTALGPLRSRCGQIPESKITILWQYLVPVLSRVWRTSTCSLPPHNHNTAVRTTSRVIEKLFNAHACIGNLVISVTSRADDAVRIPGFKSSELFKMADGKALKKSSFMKWSEKHDIFLCREILFMKPYQFKGGSPQSENARKNIASDLCEVKGITFNANKKSVRDRYRLLLEKHKKKMRTQEGSSGSSTYKTELDQLLQNIVEESREASENYETDTKDKHEKGLKDRKDAEEVRQKALESLAQTDKRHTEEVEQSQSSNSKKRPQKTGSETILYSSLGRLYGNNRTAWVRVSRPSVSKKSSLDDAKKGLSHQIRDMTKSGGGRILRAL